MNAKFEQLEAAMNAKLDLLLKAQEGATSPSTSEHVKAISISCSFCQEPTHEIHECQLYHASLNQGVLDEKVCQIDNYNSKYYPSKFNHPHQSYGRSVQGTNVHHGGCHAP